MQKWRGKNENYGTKLLIIITLVLKHRNKFEWGKRSKRCFAVIFKDASYWSDNGLNSIKEVGPKRNNEISWHAWSQTNSTIKFVLLRVENKQRSGVKEVHLIRTRARVDKDWRWYTPPLARKWKNDWRIYLHGLGGIFTQFNSRHNTITNCINRHNVSFLETLL